MESIELEEEDANLVRPARKRFFLLFLYVIMSTSITFQTMVTSSSTKFFSIYYGVDYLFINMTSMVFTVVYIFLIIPCTWFLKTFGLYKTLVTGAALNAAGALFKCLKFHEKLFWFLMTGQLIVAIGSVFVLIVPSYLAYSWFLPSENVKVVSICILSSTMGAALALFGSPYIINTDHGLKQENLQLLTNGLAVITTLLLFLIIIFFRKKTKSTRKYQCIHLNHKNYQISEKSHFSSLKTLFTSKNYVLQLLAHGIHTGVTGCFTVIFNQIITNKFHGSERDAGTMGFLFLITGIFGVYFAGSILDEIQNHKKLAIAWYAISIIIMISFAIILHISMSLWPFYPISIIFGFFMFGYRTFGYELGVHLGSSEPKGTTFGLMTASYSLFLLFYTIACSKISEIHGNIYVNTVLIISLFIGLILTIFIKDKV